MPIATDIRKTLTDSTYAVAGAGDLAVEKLREVPARLAGLRVEPKVVQDRVTDTLNTVQSAGRTLPERAQSVALTGIGKASEAYEDLAARGKNVVGRIRRQKATQDLKASARTTVAKVEATAGTAKSSATATQRAAKSAAGSAAKTAKVGEKAARDAADKIG